MTLSNRPPLAITMGDPAGVGPEVIIGAWSNAQIHAATRPIVLGHPEILRRAAKLLKRNLIVVEVDVKTTLDSAEASPEVLSCVKACDDAVVDIPVGKLNAQA